MFDFKINNTGDLMLEEASDKAKARIQFGISKYPLLNISFAQNKTSEKIENRPENLKIVFSVNRKHKDKNCQTLFDEEELKQRIMIMFRTELGSMPTDTTFGSTINTMRHEDITEEKVLEKIREIAETELFGVLKKPVVKVKREITNEIFGSQNINIYIYDDETPVYDFTMEEL